MLISLLKFFIDLIIIFYNRILSFFDHFLIFFSYFLIFCWFLLSNFFSIWLEFFRPEFRNFLIIFSYFHQIYSYFVGFFSQIFYRFVHNFLDQNSVIFWSFLIFSSDLLLFCWFLLSIFLSIWSGFFRPEFFNFLIIFSYFHQIYTYFVDFFSQIFYRFDQNFLDQNYFTFW